MSPRECFAAVSLIAAGCLAIAGTFAWHGLWVPLPFAGLEVLALAGCVAWVVRQGRRVETIEFSRERISVRAGGVGPERAADFHPGWLRIELRPGPYPGYPRRLVLTSHGREFEVGGFLNDDERHALFGELRRSLRAVRAGRRAGNEFAPGPRGLD